MEKEVVILDIDDTLIDTSGAIERCLKIQIGSHCELENGIYWDPDKPWYKEAHELICANDFYSMVKPLNDALEVFPKFYRDEKLDVLLCTAETIGVRVEGKKNLIASLYPDFDITNRLINCVDKSRIRANWIVDDYHYNIDICSRYGVKGLLYTSKDNMSLNYPRVNCLGEAYTIIKSSITI